MIKAEEVRNIINRIADKKLEKELLESKARHSILQRLAVSKDFIAECIDIVYNNDEFLNWLSAQIKHAAKYEYKNVQISIHVYFETLSSANPTVYNLLLSYEKYKMNRDELPKVVLNKIKAAGYTIMQSPEYACMYTIYWD